MMRSTAFERRMLFERRQRAPRAVGAGGHRVRAGRDGSEFLNQAALRVESAGPGYVVGLRHRLARLVDYAWGR